jgi:hypothetical protein
VGHGPRQRRDDSEGLDATGLELEPAAIEAIGRSEELFPE